METIITCPAGRRRYLRILVRYIDELYRRDLIHGLHLWVNTDVPEDVRFIEGLARERRWVELIYRPRAAEGFGVGPYFDYCTSPDTLYVRVDDDVVFLDVDRFADFVAFRVRHPEYFLVYANTINNVLCSHIHQRMGMVGDECGVVAWDPFDDVGWQSGAFAEWSHTCFLQAYHDQALQGYRFPERRMQLGERLSTHVISWLGSEFAEFSGIVDAVDDEHWLSCVRPAIAGKPNAIFGDFLASHFAYGPQRDHMDNTAILEEYDRISSTL
jgi:hypothetical protein